MHKYFREFKNIIFMGNGHSNCTVAKILKLHRLLDKCIIEIGGLQQTPMGAEHPSGKPDGWDKEYENGWKNVREMVCDIATALTGDEIIFPEKPNNSN